MIKASLESIKPWKVFRHPVSGALHCLGALVGAVSLILAIRQAISLGLHDSAQAQSLLSSPVNALERAMVFGFFCLAMMGLYLASTLYHWLKASERTIRRLRKLDHSMIFIFISASFTPFLWLNRGELSGGIWLGVVWGATLMGVLLKIFYLGKSRWLTVLPYVGLGSVGFVILPILQQTLSGAQLTLLVVGGVTYIVGSLVYGLKRPDPFPSVFGFHEIWHLFVLGGSFCHLWAIADYLKISGHG